MAYTAVNDPSAFFQCTTYTGNGGTQSITNIGNSNLRPDLVWIKQRNGTNGHKLDNSRRGAGEFLATNTSDAEGTDGNGLTAFNTDGFSVGSSGSYNGNSDTYVAWQWAANGVAPTKTYKVVVVSDSGNKYRFRNSTDTATFGASAQTVDLQEGGTYTFDVSDNTVDSHPFVIGTSANSNEYSTGVVYKLDGVTKTYSQYTSGFSAASSRQLIITVAASAPTLYYWCSQHSGMGGQINTNANFGSSNFDGSVKSISNANTTSGFSIVQWTGTGALATIGHGLGKEPRMIWIKNLGASQTWNIYNQDVGSNRYLTFGTGAYNTASNRFDDTDATTSVFTVKTNNDVNQNGNAMIAYCFADVPGYQKIGVYRGNGNINRGPVMNTGFKPAFVLWKNYTGSGIWGIKDNRRGAQTAGNFAINPVDKRLDANDNDAENTDHIINFYSHGFEPRDGGAAQNGSGDYYIYLACAAAPVVGNDTNATPGTAG